MSSICADEIPFRRQWQFHFTPLLSFYSFFFFPALTFACSTPLSSKNDFLVRDLWTKFYQQTVVIVVDWNPICLKWNCNNEPRYTNTETPTRSKWGKPTHTSIDKNIPHGLRIQAKKQCSIWHISSVSSFSYQSLNNFPHFFLASEIFAHYYWQSNFAMKLEQNWEKYIAKSRTFDKSHRKSPRVKNRMAFLEQALSTLLLNTQL